MSTPLLAERDIETVVLVADIYDEAASEAAPDRRRDLEKTSRQTLSSITQALNALDIATLHIETLDQLSHRASQRRPGDLVISIYGGERSRNRMALVPAICEAFHMRFIGPDTYGRIVCQDKEISKRLAVQCGVHTPRYRLVRTPDDIRNLVAKTFPLVVKPNLEGSSIGISQRSIVHSLGELQEVALSLLEEFEQPALIEEFVGGREVCFNVIEAENTPYTSMAEIRMIGQDEYFHEHLFTADIKAPWNDLEVGSLRDAVDKDECEAILRLVAAVGGIGYCRIDGKLLDGHFNFIEITPDAWLDPNGAFALSFTQIGWSYPKVLEKILASEPEGRRHLASSG